MIVGPDGAPWITDGGLNAIVRVDPRTQRVRRFPLPSRSVYANLNTATFDRRGVLWFTGQSGIYGRLDPKTGRMRVFAAPRGRVLRHHDHSPRWGLPRLARGELRRSNQHQHRQSHRLAAADPKPGCSPCLVRLARPDLDQRMERWELGMYDPARRRWREWRLPGRNPQAYAVYVDERDVVWLTDFGANAIVRFDPRTQRFTQVRLPSAGANVRQLLGRRGELWGAESGVDKLVVVRSQ